VTASVSTPVTEQDIAGVTVTIFFTQPGSTPREIAYDFDTVASTVAWDILSSNASAVRGITVSPYAYNASSSTQRIDFIFDINTPRANISSIVVVAYDAMGLASIAAVDASGKPAANASPIAYPGNTPGGSCPRPEPKPKDLWQCVNGRWRSSIETVNLVSNASVTISSPVIVDGSTGLRIAPCI
jgi:hypothetical protein